MNKRALSLLSLGMKAGKLAVGENACEKALRSGEARLIIIAEDASDNTKKKFTNKAFYYKTQVIVCGTSEAISRAIGKGNRMVIAVTDDGFADGLQKSLVNMEVGGCLN